MIGFLLKRPVAVIMSTIAFLVLGAVAMFQLPVSLMPDVDIPEISIHYTQDMPRSMKWKTVSPTY